MGNDTTANVTDQFRASLLAQYRNKLAPASPFDFGAGSVNPSKAIDPGPMFNTYIKHYIHVLCAVPGVDNMSIRRAVGVGCPLKRKKWCSDLNTASVIVSNLVGSRKVIRRVTNIGDTDEKYRVIVRQPVGVKITVTTQTFKISVIASRYVTLLMDATQRTNAYTFGEMVLEGNNNHEVRVPVTVFISSVLGF